MTDNGLILNLGVVGISGTLFGMPFEALILGAMAGAIAHGLGAKSPRKNGVVNISTSTILAGALTPLFVHLLVSHTAINARFLDIAVPVIIGASWSWFIPLIDAHARKLVDKYVGKITGEDK